MSWRPCVGVPRYGYVAWCQLFELDVLPWSAGRCCFRAPLRSNFGLVGHALWGHEFVFSITLYGVGSSNWMSFFRAHAKCCFGVSGRFCSGWPCVSAPEFVFFRIAAIPHLSTQRNCLPVVGVPGIAGIAMQFSAPIL